MIQRGDLARTMILATLWDNEQFVAKNNLEIKTLVMIISQPKNNLSFIEVLTADGQHGRVLSLSLEKT